MDAQDKGTCSSYRKTEYEVLKSEALVKKTQALLKVKALGEGIKTTSAQDTYAESKE